MTILDDFDDIQYQTVIQNGRWQPLDIAHKRFWGNLVTICQVNLNKYGVE